MQKKKNPVLEEDFHRLGQADIPYENWKGKTFLITGATGLVGSLAVKALLHISQVHQLHLQVVAQVRNTEKAKKVLPDNPNLTLLAVDLAQDPLAYEGAVDYILHTAAVTTSKLLVSDPVGCAKTALNGTLSVLDFAVQKQAKGVVYLSSMEAYGVHTDGGDVTEQDLGYVDLQAVRSGYPESKRMCESLCSAYASQYQLPVYALRLAQTFGAGVSREDTRVFAQFAKSAMNGSDIILHTDGSSEGNYIYTADALMAIFLLWCKGEPGQIYNAANEVCHTTIYDMAQMVAQKVAGGAISVQIQIPQDAASLGYAPKTRLRLSSQKLRSLGWEPETDLEQAYRRLIFSWEVEDLG